MNPKVDELLTDLYYNLDNPAAFSGVEKLYSAAKEKQIPVSKKQIKNWLHFQKGYTLHFPKRKQFRRRKIISYGPMWLVEGDLGLMPDLKWYTGGYEYILVVVCTFTRFLFALPLKTKSGPEVAAALKQIFSTAKPPILQFRTGNVKHFLKLSKQ